MDDFKKNEECSCEHDHCDCEHDDCDCENELITIVLDDDTELQCSVIGIFPVDDKEYIALLPENDDEILMYRYNETDNEDGIELALIESDDEFDKVEDTFYALYGEDEEE